ncbi:hypothetical protein Lepto7375DRAFT_0715 [Leptolyngbya sp. PCC 7375]|nr:hypothetical protein Lepto7375DRAFT_0715 [Leptolyngbya sp. PCC 7375]
MVKTLISYTLAAGILTPPVILGNQPTEPDAPPLTSHYPLVRVTQPVQINKPIPHNLPTVVPPPAVAPIPQPITPQLVTYRPERVPVARTSESLSPPEPPAPVEQEPTEFALSEPHIPTDNPDVTSEEVSLLPASPTIENSDVETPETPDSSTDLTILRDVTPQAHISSTAPLSTYDIMSGERLWETTEPLTVQASNHQVLLDDQAHTELILTVPNNESITVNGTDYLGGLIIRAQEDELYVINYLSGEQVMTVRPEVIPTIPSFSNRTEALLAQSEPAHHWYDLDGRLPEKPPQIARREPP